MARPFNRNNGRVGSNANNRSWSRVLLTWVATAKNGESFMRMGLSLSVRRRHALCSKVSTAVAAILGSAAAMRQARLTYDNPAAKFVVEHQLELPPRVEEPHR